MKLGWVAGGARVRAQYASCGCEVKRTLRALRQAVSSRKWASFAYTQGDGTVVEARVRALCLRYVGGTWTPGGWSEIDAAFRAFRVYRIVSLVLSQECFGIEPGRNLADYLAAAERLGAGS